MRSSRLCLSGIFLVMLLVSCMLITLFNEILVRTKGFRLLDMYNPVKSVKVTDEQMIEFQRERSLHIKNACEFYKANSTEISETVLKQMIVIDKYKTLYCFIPKSGCTHWKTVLYTALHGHSDDRIHNSSLYNFLYQYSDEEIQLRLKTYFKFVFVRDPLERLLSAYERKFENQAFQPGPLKHFTKEIIKNHKREDPKADDKVTFPKFISYVAGVGHEKDVHWSSYHRLCDPCAVQYDFIGHLDKMPTEGPYVLRQTGMDGIATFPPNNAHNTSSKLLNRYSEVPRSTIIKLGNALKKDLEMFNYSFPGRLSELL